MDKRQQTLIWAAGLGFFIAMIFTFVGRGSLNQWLIVESMMILIGGPLALLSLTALFISRFHNPPLLRWMTTFMMAVVVVIFTLGLSVLTGKIVHTYDIKAAQKYCESFVPALELYESKYNYYPSDLGKLKFEPTSKFPILLELGTFFSASGDSFRFYLPEPAANGSWYEYTSKNKKWVLSNSR